MHTRRKFIRDIATGLLLPSAVARLSANPYGPLLTANVSSSTCLLLDSCTTSLSTLGAYSVARKLRSAYAGSAFKVRRASDSTTQDIGFNADGTVDTTSLASFCAGTDGFIDTLYDQASTKNMTQATTARQPKVVTSGTVAVDSAGRVVMIFDGSDDGIGISSITFGAQFTTFSVFQNTAFTTGKQVINCGSTSRGAVAQNTSGGNHIALASGTSLDSTITLSTGTRYIVRACIDTASSSDSIKITNNAETGGSAGNNGGTQMVFGDATNCFSGKLSEAIWFNVAITDSINTTDQTAIISNQQAFYSL